MSVTEPVAAVEPPRSTGGVDWATDDHTVAVVATDGEQTDRFSVTHDAAVLRTLVRRLAGRRGSRGWASNAPTARSSTPWARAGWSCSSSRPAS
jgi:hypothetical protein